MKSREKNKRFETNFD